MASVWRLVLRLLYWVYLPLSVLSVLVVPLAAIGLIRHDPFMTVLALVLGIPWSILFPWWVDSSSTLLNFLLMVLALAMNALLLRFLARRRRQPAEPDPFGDEAEPDDAEDDDEPD